MQYFEKIGQTIYAQKRRGRELPRIPLEGNLDLTYRCNNNCRHCWIRISPRAPEKKDELSFEEIKQLAADARKMGCQKWNLSGGEPMLRPDFAEIFDFLTAKAVYYRLNTNGTLITPAIARLLRRQGGKMVALYGATAEVNDHITRSPGSFAAAMQGFAYLKEAGAGLYRAAHSHAGQLPPVARRCCTWPNHSARIPESAPPGCIFLLAARGKATPKSSRSG